MHSRSCPNDLTIGLSVVQLKLFFHFNPDDRHNYVQTSEDESLIISIILNRRRVQLTCGFAIARETSRGNVVNEINEKCSTMS